MIIVVMVLLCVCSRVNSFVFLGRRLPTRPSLLSSLSLSLMKPHLVTTSSVVRMRNENQKSMSNNEPISGNDGGYFFSQKSFSEIGIAPFMQPVLLHLNITRPSRIQRIAFPHLISGHHIVIAEQTGSGKTLSYLLPLIQVIMSRIRNHELPPSLPYRPYLVVLCPTSELAWQVASIVRSISNVLKFRSSCISPDCDMNAEEKKLRLGVEVLVATPGKLATLLSTKPDGETIEKNPPKSSRRLSISLESALAIVLDEADALLGDETFPLKRIGDAVTSNSTQFVFVTATLPRNVEDIISAEFPHVKYLKGPGFHKVSSQILLNNVIDCSISPRMPVRKIVRKGKYENDYLACPPSYAEERAIGEESEEFEDYSDTSLQNSRFIKREPETVEGNKCKALVNLFSMSRYHQGLRRIVVFCNSIESCRAAENALLRSKRKDKSCHIYAFHGAIDPEIRISNYIEFCAIITQPIDSSIRSGLSPNTRVLISTDRAARGLDFKASQIDHVVLFDFPRDPSEFLRRVGRAGRVGRPGQVTAFAYGRQVRIANDVLQASSKGIRLQ